MHALERVYRERRRALMRLAQRFVRPPVTPDDVVQEVFIRTLALVRAGRLDESVAYYPYLCGAIRKTAQAPRFQDPVVEPESWMLVPTKPSALTRLAVAEAWDELTPQERVAITQLHILEEDMSRVDRNVFTSRIRVARRRLGAVA